MLCYTGHEFKDISLYFSKENELRALKMIKNSEVNSQFYPLNMLLVLSAKYFTQALSERKENFASAS